MPYPGRLRQWVDIPGNNRVWCEFSMQVFESGASPLEEIEFPALVQDFMEENHFNHEIVCAFVNGILDHIGGLEIWEGARKRGYSSRIHEGDAYEEGWMFADHHK